MNSDLTSITHPTKMQSKTFALSKDVTLKVGDVRGIAVSQEGGGKEKFVPLEDVLSAKVTGGDKKDARHVVIEYAKQDKRTHRLSRRSLKLPVPLNGILANEVLERIHQELAAVSQDRQGFIFGHSLDSTIFVITTWYSSVPQCLHI